MKTTRILGVLFFGMLAHASLLAQSVTFMIIDKTHYFTQTDNTTVGEAGTNAWGFDAHIEGTQSTNDLSAIATPTLAIPGGSGSTTMAYIGSENSWRVTSNYANQAALDLAYFNGNYSLTALGQTITPIDLSLNSYPVAPTGSLSAGTISSGVLFWNPAQALTITISGTGIDHMGIFVDGNSYNDGSETFGGTTLSFLIPASSMIAGNSYTVKMDFDDIVGGTNVFSVVGGALNGAKYAGVYTAETTFTIQAIPEPATYAEIFGLVALAGVMFQRRRRLA